MAIYEFICRTCRKGFDVMRPALEASATVRCPHCGSANVERRPGIDPSTGERDKLGTP